MYYFATEITSIQFTCMYLLLSPDVFKGEVGRSATITGMVSPSWYCPLACSESPTTHARYQYGLALLRYFSAFSFAHEILFGCLFVGSWLQSTPRKQPVKCHHLSSPTSLLQWRMYWASHSHAAAFVRRGGMMQSKKAKMMSNPQESGSGTDAVHLTIYYCPCLLVNALQRWYSQAVFLAIYILRRNAVIPRLHYLK